MPLFLYLSLQCVVLTETKLSLQKRINQFCHSQQPPIKVQTFLGILHRYYTLFG